MWRTLGLRWFWKLYYVVANKPFCEIIAFGYNYNTYNIYVNYIYIIQIVHVFLKDKNSYTHDKQIRDCFTHTHIFCVID